MNDEIENNLNNQINRVREEIRVCSNEDFDNAIYKYRIFNNIKNTLLEEIVETNLFKNILEKDTDILNKIFNKFLDINLIAYSLPETFDEVMLETFLSKIKFEEIEENEEQEMES
ncbi:MAG: hypothetical protein Q4G09_00160 [Clostridia bacterium]|nr:hypothetical protein [Clostridia bacterium]